MRLFKKPKIGLALGSGAARGLAHIGIIKALKEKKIAINLIAGSSIGAFEFFRGKEAILEGYQAAKEALEVRRVGAKAWLKHYTEIMFF